MSAKGIPISPLIKAIRESKLNAVTEAIDQGADIEEADLHRQPGLPLRTACFIGKIEIVRELLQRGADINVGGINNPSTPLKVAVRAKHKDIVNLLVASGVQIPPEITLPQDEQETTPEKKAAPADGNTIEFTIETVPAPLVEPKGNDTPRSEHERYNVIEEVDIPASYGLDTNLLTMDLLRFNESPDEATPLPARKTPSTVSTKNTAFWKSGNQT